MKMTITSMTLNSSAHSTILKALREFGYPKLTLEDVALACDRAQSGTSNEKSVIDVMTRKILQDTCDKKNGD